MKINYDNSSKKMIIKIDEEIDHCLAEKLRRKMDYEIQKCIPQNVIFDFSDVTFMDSSGIGMIVGRYKLISALGGTVEITNLKPNLERIFKMSGVLKIIPERKS